MRKPAPCANCATSGTVHERCNKYTEWKKQDEEFKATIRKNKYKDADWYAFRNGVFK